MIINLLLICRYCQFRLVYLINTALVSCLIINFAAIVYRVWDNILKFPYLRQFSDLHLKAIRSESLML